MSVAIPTKARQDANSRDLGRCQRCGGPGGHLHHRQRRREGKHDIENLVSMCLHDHAWAHSHPREAVDEGFIVPTWVARESIHLYPIRTIWGWRLLTTDGAFVSAAETGEE